MANSSMNIPNITVFIDTMIFLHFKPFEEVDWRSVFNAIGVTLIVSPVILTELDEHKDTHPNIKLRKRAKSIVRRLHQLLENDINAEIRPGVIISYCLSDSDLDFEQHRLNSNRRDDQQLAIILDYLTKHEGEQVVLLTNDFNLRQRAKLLGIETKKMPDEYELPDEIDPNEKLIKELQQQILELQRQQPILSLNFSNNSDRLPITLAQPKLQSSIEMQQELDQIKSKLPKMRIRVNKPIEESDLSKRKTRGTRSTLADLQRMISEGLAQNMGGYDEEDIQEYNSKLDHFFASYEQYLHERTKYEVQNMLTVELSLVVLNSGTAPAEDLDVYLHFPDGFELTDELISPPSEPTPPARPLTAVQKYASRSSVIQSILDSSIHRPAIDLSKLNAAPPNVSSPKIRRTKSYDVHFKIRRIKHSHPITLDPLYLTFDSYDDAKSFGIQFRLNAANVPREVTGYLNVIITKTD